jgi:hypothetical protein
MTLSGARGQTKPRIYVGESDDLLRRAAGYRRPAEGQTTKLRLNARLKAQFAAGGAATLDIGTSVAVELGEPGRSRNALDLTRKAARLLAENAALVTAHLAGDADIENLE